MAPARQQPPPPFGKDEKVLCFHMDMLYEAKIMDVQPAEKPNEGYRYKVHYKGWKNTWDDWVLVDRIRPFDDEHKELAAQLHAQLKNSMQKTSKVPKKIVKSGGESARGSEERGSAVTQGGRGGRRGKDWELEQVRLDLPSATDFPLFSSSFLLFYLESFKISRRFLSRLYLARGVYVLHEPRLLKYLQQLPAGKCRAAQAARRRFDERENQSLEAMFSFPTSNLFPLVASYARKLRA